ncbi:MAG: CMP deaminase, partial [Crocinitomicaceae bacterium]|nr:CMP deaminase [Crocinitomicaceae bacterium]
MALEWGKLSHCKRKQVGSLIVKDNMIISDGYNGTPSGYTNSCEDENGETHWYVLHAEANAILKVAKSTQSADGATLYITLSPCK